MASANVKEFNEANWDQEVIQSDQLVLVDFWAPWCMPCRQMGPTIDRLADRFAGKVKIGKVNTDENEDLAMRYGISSIPTVLFFRNDEQPKMRLVGMQSEDTLEKTIEALLAD